MDKETFKQLLEELDGNSIQTLTNKNAKYAQSTDVLHNFNMGADIMGTTPSMACWGYLTKHLVALRDMVERNDFSDREDFLEKCQDTINYVRFLWCIGNEHEDYYPKDINRVFPHGIQKAICGAVTNETQEALDKRALGEYMYLKSKLEKENK